MTIDDFSLKRIAHLRQLALDCLNQYGGGFANLERINRDLKSIIRSLNDVADRSWVDVLRQQWGQLEIIYACMLAEERFQLTSDEEHDVQGIVAELRPAFEGYQLPSVVDGGEAI